MALQDRPRSFGGNDKAFEEAPEGTFAAVLVTATDAGVEPNKFYKEGDPDWKKEKHDVRLGWLIDRAMKDGRPFLVSQWVSLRVTLSRKAKMRSKLTELAEMLLGKTIWEIDRETDAKTEMDIVRALRGHPGLVTVKHSAGGRARVAMVSPMPRLPDGSPALALPDTGTMLDDVKIVQRQEPKAQPADIDRIRTEAEGRARELGGANVRDIIEAAKSVLGIQMVNTMPISKVEPLIEQIKLWEPPVGGSTEDLPF